MKKAIYLLAGTVAVVLIVASVMTQNLRIKQEVSDIEVSGNYVRSEKTPGIPHEISYQGYLEENGQPANGIYSMEFSIWTSASGGSSCWSRTYSVTVTDGRFSVVLGSGAAIPSTCFTAGIDRWLQIKISGTTLTPRTKLTSSPFSYTTAMSDSSAYSYDSDLLDGYEASDFLTESEGDTRYVNSDECPLTFQCSSPSEPVLTVINTSGETSLKLKTGNFSIDSVTNYKSIEINNSQGMYVGEPVGTGLEIASPSARGIRILDSGSEGIEINGTGTDGIRVSYCGDKGINIRNPAQEGIRINAAGSYGILISGSADYDIRAQGDVLVEGDFTCQGNKQFAQDYPGDPTKEIVYVALEGGEAGTYCRGSSHLISGKATLHLPEHFSLVTSDSDLTVQVTPRGDCLGLYIESLSTTEIVVKELQNGKSNVSFDYIVHGVRKGYENHDVIRTKTELSSEK